MSTLSVDNRILKYKGISYQISQITSMKVVTIKLKNRKKASLQPLKKSIPISIIGIFIAFAAVQAESGGVALVAFLIAMGSAYYSYSVIVEKIQEMKGDKYSNLYGLSLRLSNGDDPIYTSTNRKLIFNIRDAVSDSMNGSGGAVSVNFDNVNIEITDAENVEIGNVVKG